MKNNILKIFCISCLLLSFTGKAQDRQIIAETPLLLGTPAYITPDSGVAKTERNQLVFTPPTSPKTQMVVVPLPQEQDFMVYDQLVFETVAENDDADVTVILDAAWPLFNNVIKNRIHLDQGVKKHVYAIPHAGYKTNFRQISFTFHHEKEPGRGNRRSVLSAPVVIRGITLQATTSSLNSLKNRFEHRISYPLPSGLPANALQAADARRAEIRQSFSEKMAQAEQKIKAAEDIAKELKALYSLANQAAWSIEQAAWTIAASDKTIYGWTGGADKILRDDCFPGTVGGEVAVEMARNEAESFQIALYSNHDLSQVTVHPSDFRREDGMVFSADNIYCSVIGYVNPTSPAYWSDYFGHRMPDPLLDYLTSFNIERNHFQPVWFDFTASREQSAGRYTGTIEFRENGEKLLDVPVTVTVHPFALPERNSLHFLLSSGEFKPTAYERDSAVQNEFNAYIFGEDGDMSRLSTKAQRLAQINWDFFHLLRKHRLEFHDFYRSTRRVIPAWRRKIINEFNTLYCLGYDNDRNVMQNFAKQFAEMRQEGTANRAYIYGNDEIRVSDTRAFEGMKRSYGSLKAAYPELKTAATALDYTFGEKTNTTEEVDMWIVPPDAYTGNQAAAKRARERHKEVWYYPCNWPYPPFANLLLENTATATRMIVGLLPWLYQADGVLYYASFMLRQQIQTDSLMKKWTRRGHIVDMTNGFFGYDGQYRMIPADSREQTRLECWTFTPSRFDKPLVFEFEYRIMGDGHADIPAAEAELRLNYHENIKTDSHRISLAAASDDWQKVSKTVKISGPARNMLVAFRLQGTSEVQLRNVDLRQPEVMMDRRTDARQLLHGGPVLSDEFNYSMFRSNGDGTLVYPGPKGALPTNRLKFLRDGLEDYEYLSLLQKAVEAIRNGNRTIDGRDAWLEEALALLAIDKSVCRGMSDFTHSGSELLSFRHRIANLLNRYEKDAH